MLYARSVTQFTTLYYTIGIQVIHGSLVLLAGI